MKQIFIKISDYPIRLGQFLKLADIVADGGSARALLDNRSITVNERVETRRGRQLQPGDRVVYEDTCYLCR